MRIYTSNQVNEIVFELKNNKAVILPTDTVMGIISLTPELIYKIKNRSASQKLITFVNNIKSINLPDNLEKIISKYWPGQLTIIYKKNSYRWPDNKLIDKIINLSGPVFSSSANISGQLPIKNEKDAIKKFAQHTWELVVVEGESKNNVASTIINLDNNTVVRNGILDGKKIIEEISKLGSRE